MPTDEQYKTWIEQAEAGSVDAARWLINELAQCLYRNEPIPEPLRTYFAPRLARIGGAQGPDEEPEPEADAMAELGLSRHGRPRTEWWAYCDLVTAAIDITETSKGTLQDAFGKLHIEGIISNISPCREDSPDGRWHLSESRIGDLFYEYVHEYASVFRSDWYNRWLSTPSGQKSLQKWRQKFS